MSTVDLEGRTILITGAAGFIGAALAERLLKEFPDISIIGLDNMNSYYDVRIKEERLKKLEKYQNFIFIKGDVSDRTALASLFDSYKPQIVAHLAAQAGVRYSITNPEAYISSNIIGFFNILEECRRSLEKGEKLEHLVFASSSSVYGSNSKIPYSTEDKTDSPVSLYAATKKSDELLAHAYAKLYGISITGLRFFTVYGPSGRPDMAYFKFADKLTRGENIQIYNYGNCRRDFTYIDDTVEGLVRVMKKAPDKKTGEDGLPLPPYKIYNIGGGRPENLLDMVEILEEELLKAGLLPEGYDLEAHKELLPMQPGDVAVTYADTKAFEKDFGFRPCVALKEGLHKFVAWYADFIKTST